MADLPTESIPEVLDTSEVPDDVRIDVTSKGKHVLTIKPYELVMVKDGEEVGVLSWDTGIVTFTGKADETVKQLNIALPEFTTYLKNQFKQD